MHGNLRHRQHRKLNRRALLNAILLGGSIVFLVWLGVAIYSPNGGPALYTIIAGTFAATVVSAFLAGRLCGLRRRADGVAHGISVWTVVMAFAGLSLLPSVNALDLSDEAGNLFQRLQMLAGEIYAGEDLAAERAQLTNLLARAGVAATPQLIGELEKAAAAADRDAILDLLQRRPAVDAARAESVANHAITLYQDADAAAADRLVARENVKSVAVGAWWLMLVLISSLLLSIWAGVRGVHAATQSDGPHPAH